MENDPNCIGEVRAFQTTVEYVEARTGLAYADLIDRFEQELGRLDPAATNDLVAQKAAWSQVKSKIERMAGPRGLMIIFRADQGAVTSLSGTTKRSSLYIVGNLVIASDIIEIDPRASFYVPFRVCIYDDGGPSGAIIGYDRPSSFLGALAQRELVAYGELLDAKIDGLVRDLCKKT